MQQLLVLRHAKAVPWSGQEQDFARRLQPVGIEHARRIAAWIGEHLDLPDCVLCSPSQRTRETLAPLLFRQARLEAVTRFVPQIYLASPPTLESILSSAFADSERVLIVGHNPGLEVLIGDVIHRRHHRDYHRLPTGTLAVIDFESGWETDRGRGTLRHFIRGKQLD